MRFRAVIAWCLLVFILSTPAQAAKNAVYKGSYSSTDLVTGKVTTTSLYLVLGDEAPVSGPDDRYTYMNGVFVLLNGQFGKKRFAVGSAGARFRSVESTIKVGKKTKTVEVITQIYNSDPTDSGAGYYTLDGLILTGRHGSLKYDFPLTLKGHALSVDGGLGGPGDPPYVNATRRTMTFTLVQAITDPIPSGESLDASVERVKDFLKARGYIEYLP